MIENVDKILSTLLGIIVCIYINNVVLKGLIVLGTVQSMYAESLKKENLGNQRDSEVGQVVYNTS